jgi:hypothetical protein
MSLYSPVLSDSTTFSFWTECLCLDEFCSDTYKDDIALLGINVLALQELANVLSANPACSLFACRQITNPADGQYLLSSVIQQALMDNQLSNFKTILMKEEYNINNISNGTSSGDMEIKENKEMMDQIALLLFEEVEGVAVFPYEKTSQPQRFQFAPTSFRQSIRRALLRYHIDRLYGGKEDETSRTNMIVAKAFITQV